MKIGLRIGEFELGKGAALAPMAGVTDRTMRALCAEFGATLTVSEMVSARALTMGDRKSYALLRGRAGTGNRPAARSGSGASHRAAVGSAVLPSAKPASALKCPSLPGCPSSAAGASCFPPGCFAMPAPQPSQLSAHSAPPYGVQLFGSEPAVLAEAVERIAGEDFDFLDLNLGCPAPKIATHGSGAGLLRDPACAEAFAAAAVRASSRPVTAKLRIGWDEGELTGFEVAKRLEAAGVCLLAVHGRTRAQQYAPGVNHEAVAAIKAAVKVPVLFNGDVDSAEAALAAIQRTGCDGVMIGRAAVGNPFLFAEVAAALGGGAPPAPPSLGRRLEVMERQIRGMCEEKGEERAMREARKVAAGYLRGLRGAAALRRAAHSLTFFSDVAALADEVWRYNG